MCIISSDCNECTKTEANTTNTTSYTTTSSMLPQTTPSPPNTTTGVCEQGCACSDTSGHSYSSAEECSTSNACYLDSDSGVCVNRRNCQSCICIWKYDLNNSRICPLDIFGELDCSEIQATQSGICSIFMSTTVTLTHTDLNSMLWQFMMDIFAFLLFFFLFVIIGSAVYVCCILLMNKQATVYGKLHQDEAHVQPAHTLPYLYRIS